MIRLASAWIRIGLTTPIVATTVAALAGCASGPPQSGFLSDYSGFHQLDQEAEIWEYVDRNAGERALHARVWGDRTNWKALANYDRVMVDPVVVHPLKDSQIQWVPQARLDKISRFMHDALTEAMGDRYPVVDTPGDRVLRFRIAITDVDGEYVYVTPDLDKHPVKAWMNSSPGKLITEGEATDSMTGERVLGLITDVRGDFHPSAEGTDPFEEPREAVRGVAKFMRHLMDKAHAMN